MLGFPFIFHRENWIKSGSTIYRQQGAKGVKVHFFVLASSRSFFEALHFLMNKTREGSGGPSRCDAGERQQTGPDG
jgi:hypothetical protein